ncbi:MAG: hypothetical protein WCE30_01955 [Mycobacterium sp.]
MRRIPASIVSPLARTVVVTTVVLGTTALVTLVVVEGVTLFAGIFSAPTIGALAFEPHAVSSVTVDPVEAQRARRDILSDATNPLRCVSRPDMKSGARAVMSVPAGDGSAPGAADNAGAEPVQVTDETAALLPAIEEVVATVPRGSEFFQTYAFVVTALNGGVDSWQRFVSVTTQLQLSTPTSRQAAMATVKVFFTPDSDFSVTEGLSAAVMMRLTSSHVIDGEQQAGELLEDAAGRCQ